MHFLEFSAEKEESTEKKEPDVKRSVEILAGPAQHGQEREHDEDPAHCCHGSQDGPIPVGKITPQKEEEPLRVEYSFDRIMHCVPPWMLPRGRSPPPVRDFRSRC